MMENKGGIREDKFRVALPEPEDGCESGAITVSLYFIMIRRPGEVRREEKQTAASCLKKPICSR